MKHGVTLNRSFESVRHCCSREFENTAEFTIQKTTIGRITAMRFLCVWVGYRDGQ